MCGCICDVFHEIKEIYDVFINCDFVLILNNLNDAFMREIFLCYRRFRWRLLTVFGMKSIFLLIGLFMFVFVAQAGGQQKRVNLDLHDVTINVVLDEIQKQTNLSFLFNPEQTNKIGTVSVQANNEAVQSVLDRVFSGTNLMYRFRDDLIVIYQKAKTAADDKRKEIRISGKVTDESKMPLPGVTVLVKDLNIGTATDADGSYKLTLPVLKDTNFVFIFSFVGYASQTIKYTGQDTINVVMKEEVKKMDEVVVTGYNRVKKESFTGNATTVTKDQLLKTNNKNVIAALQSFDPSFRIKQNNLFGSDPNSLPEFTIRGESSIGMNRGLDVAAARRSQRTNLEDNPNLPIFILDGFEVDVQKIYDMDMNRIESMTILKDAAATAMYGSRAANGVVVVTTVAPKPGELRVMYNFTGGAEFPDLSDYNLCNAWEMLEVERLAGLFTAEDGDPGVQANLDYKYNQLLNEVARGVRTDWLAQPLRNVFNHSHSLNISGGVESIRYSLDLNYGTHNGAMKGSYRDNMGVGLTLDYRKGERLQVMNSITFNVTKSEDSPYGDFSTYAALKPYWAPYDNDGNLLETLGNSNSTANPLFQAKYLGSYSGKTTLNDLTNNLSVNLFFDKGFSAKAQLSVTRTDSEAESFDDPKEVQFNGVDSKEKGILDITTSNGLNWNVNVMAYFNRSFNHHFVNATLGINAQQVTSKTTSTLYKGFQLSNMNKPSYAAQQPDKTSQTNDESRLFGVLGSVNYSYNDVYLFDGSFRFDGSSKFGSDKRFAPFWSLGVGVNIHNYKWMQDQAMISTLRVRGTYGTTGNVSFPSYAAVSTYNTSDDWYYSFPANTLIALGNPKLTWEKTGTLDVGINLGLFQDRYTLEANYYIKKTDDQLAQLSIRTSSGFENYYTNAGSIENKGFEVKLNATIFQNEDWTVAFNGTLASNKNKITKLGQDAAQYNEHIQDFHNGELDNLTPEESAAYEDLMYVPLTQYYEGASTTAIYGVVSYGIDPSNGKEKFRKRDGSSTYLWNSRDEVVLGDTSPDAQGSFGFNIGWKGFYVNTSFLYAWGAQQYNETLLNKVEHADIANSNVDRRVLTDRWQAPGDVAPFYDIKNTTKTQPTSRFVQDDDYLQFTSLSAGYDFDQRLIQKFHLTSLGIRFNANDIARWSTIKAERGTSYPFAKNYSFTLSIGF